MQHLCLFMDYSSKKGPNKVAPLNNNLGEGAHSIRLATLRGTFSGGRIFPGRRGGDAPGGGAFLQRRL